MESQLVEPFRFPWEEDVAAPKENPLRCDIDLWRPTLHSDPNIHLGDVTHSATTKAQLTKLLNDLYGSKLQNNSAILYVTEATGTLNFKVKLEDHNTPLLLRIHKRIRNHDQLKLLHQLQIHVYNSHVFADGIQECLKPIESEVFFQDFGVYRGSYVSLAPFAEGVTHYTGTSVQELASVAEKFGALQKCLQEFNCNTHPIIGRSVSESWSQLDLPLFQLIRFLAHKASNAKVGLFADMFYQQADYLTAICSEVRGLRLAANTSPLMHDFHPHNTFFRKHKCVLIYDFEDVATGSNESAALAFSVHRFIREYLIKATQPQKRTEETIERLVDLFLENYQMGGMTVPADFKGSLHLYIKLVTLMKLLHIMSYCFRVEADPAQRSEYHWYRALQSFLGFLREAQAFSFPIG